MKRLITKKAVFERENRIVEGLRYIAGIAI